MKTSAFISFLHVLTTIVLLYPITTVESSSRFLTALAPAPAPANTNFILTSCSATLYPDVCFVSLSRYASVIQDDPSLLARAAITVSLSRARHMFSFLSNISNSSTDQLATSAIQDCCSVFSDAVNNIRDSLSQMVHLGEGTESVKFQLSNVQTWMSAALTNEDTCLEGFEGVDDDKLKVNVYKLTGRVKKVTSNALALVNSYASTVAAR